MSIIKSGRAKLIVILSMTAILVVGLVAGLGQAQKKDVQAKGVVVAPGGGDYYLLARLIFGEAANEPYEGQVAVASVILNRIRDPKFPNTLAGVIYEPDAFESVSNGQIWADNPSSMNYDAARQAINGWDPTYGCTFFWNPYKPVSSWIWSRPLVTQIGNHVFAR